jgi:hypothetical protein
MDYIIQVITINKGDLQNKVIISLYYYQKLYININFYFIITHNFIINHNIIIIIIITHTY